MTAEDITQQDLIISKLLRQDIEKYKSLFPLVSAAIQLSNSSVTDVDVLLKVILSTTFTQTHSTKTRSVESQL